MLPERQLITDWNDLAKLPLVSSTPRSVPLSCFIQSIVPDDYSRLTSISADMTGSATLQDINDMDKLIEQIDKLIGKIYPMRSTTRGLEEALAKNRSDQVKKIAGELREQLESSIIGIKQYGRETVKKLESILKNSQLWDQGLYSDVFVDHMCILLFKLLTLGKLCPTKNALANDFAVLHRMSGVGGADDIELRLWRSSPNYARQELLTALKVIDFEHSEKIFNIFFKRIEKEITSTECIYPDMETAYIVTLLFMVDFYSQQIEKEVQAKPKKKIKMDESVWTLVGNARAKYPALPLCFEYSIHFDEMITNKKMLQEKLKESPRANISVKQTMSELRQAFNDLSGQYGKLIANDKPSYEQVGKVVTKLPSVLRSMAYGIHNVRRLIGDKHEKEQRPVQEDDKLPVSQFEVAMRGLNDDERECIMQILAIVRSLRELISMNLPKVNDIIGSYIEQHIQDFVMNKLEVALIRSKNVKEFLEPDTNKIRATMGCFKKVEDMSPRAQSKGDLIPFKTDDWKSGPHLALVELLRIQLQIFLNPENPMKSKKMMAPNINKKDETEMRNFLDQSQHYLDLLQLDRTLSKVSDQSCLFFKETFLDIYRSQVQGAVYFPVTTSLPYVLIDYALQHPDHQELIGALFYPFSIYDDAAATALKYLNSKYLYNEIHAESEICLMTITKMISEHVFDEVRSFVQQRFLDQYDPKLVSVPKQEQYMSHSAVRMITIFQQNQMFVLGQHIDVKDIFGEKLNELFIDSITNQFEIVKRFGVLGIIVFSKMIDCLRDMHAVFTSHGLELSNFDDMVKSVMQTGSAESFRSVLLEAIVSNLRSKVIPKFFLHTNPYRLVPPLNGGGAIGDFIKTKKHGIPVTLKQTTTFISVEHFRELVRLLDDGAIFILMSEIKGEVSTLFNNFKAKYNEIKETVTRIRDVPVSTGCHKAYDIFEGAYRSFMNEESIQKVFEQMKALGNIIALSEMLDIAFQLKRSSMHQIASYIFMVSKDDIGKHGRKDGDDEEGEAIDGTLFEKFDQRFQSQRKFFEHIPTTPHKSEVAPPFSQSVISELATLVYEARNIFDETSRTILDFQTLKGFAAIWSVLEFIFCLREVHRKEDSVLTKDGNRKQTGGSFAMFGEGVLMFAGTLLCVSRQQSLRRVLSIGNRIVQQKKTDLAVLEEETLDRFLTCYKLVDASMDFAISSVLPAVKNVFGGK